MAEEQAAAGTGDAPVPQGPGARPGYWFPLVVFGLFIILPVPFSSYRDTGWYAYAPIGGATPGWYWVLGGTAALLLTAAWYRWHDRRTGRRTPLHGYLVAGLVLTILSSQVPIFYGRATGLWGLWLLNQWVTGIITVLLIAVGMGLLARAERSRLLLVITIVYAVTAAAVAVAANTATAIAPGWAYPGGGPHLVPPQPGLGSAFALFSPWPQPAMVLPAAVLLLAGLAALAVPHVPRRARP